MTELKVPLVKPSAPQSVNGALSSVNSWAFSEPTMAPSLSYSRDGAIPAESNPSKLTTPGKPLTVPANVPSEQVAPGASVPKKVIRPLQAPSRRPTAVKSTGAADG